MAIRDKSPFDSIQQRRVVRRQWIATTVALLCLLGFVGNKRWNIAVTLGPVQFELLSSAVVAWWHPSDKRVDFDVWEAWYSDYANAWRPFHLLSRGDHGVALPLWQPMLLASIVAAHAWGVRRGVRFADPHRCRGCGYSLIGLPESGGQRCPECGRPVESPGR